MNIFNFLIVNITLKVKLKTDEFQHRALLRTMNTFNDVCNSISEQAFEVREYQKVQLHHISYKRQREALPEFSSQLVVRAIAVVSDSYKVKRNRHQRNYFKRTSAVVYDDRVITFKGNDAVSIWTTEGRINIPIQVHNKERMAFRKGQVDLVYQNNQFFLLVNLDVPVSKPHDAKGIMGVDLGVKNIAVSSLGDVFSSEGIERKRKLYHTHRQRLQKRGTRSAKRRIKVAGKKESRFRKDVNHIISKLLVMKAKALNFGIALENLTNINKRVTVRRVNRSERMSWSFAQLRSYITYKAELCGVPLVIVDPRYTSQMCSECGHTEKANRKSQERFLCMSCGHAEHADFNASKNIASLGLQSISLLIAQAKPELVSTASSLVDEAVDKRCLNSSSKNQY